MTSRSTAFEQVAEDRGRPRAFQFHGAIATAFGCPFEGDVPTANVVRIAKRYKDLGFTSLDLGDTTGMATPPIVTRLVRALQDEVPELPVALHFHNTRGIGLVNVMAGLEARDRPLRCLVRRHWRLSCSRPKATGNICTEDLVYLLNELGIETGIDIRKLIDLACDVEAVVGRDLPGQVMKAGPRLALHDCSNVRRAVG